MILVIGATGFLGTEICRRLLANGKPVKAMVRTTSDQAKVDNLKNLGASLVQGDIKDRKSLDAACKGVTTVISTATTAVFRQPDDSLETEKTGLLSLVDAAKAAGVSHFIFVSYSGAWDNENPAPLTVAKRAVEEKLKNSGMTYTIMRPTCFMGFWLSPIMGFDFANAKVTMYGSGETKLSWTVLEDVAQFAVDAVDNPAARNASFELGGPEAVGYLDVIKMFEEASGKKFEVQSVSEEALSSQKEGATDPYQKSFSALMLSVAQGDLIDMGATQKAFPMKLTTVKEYVERSVSAK